MKPKVIVPVARFLDKFAMKKIKKKKLIQILHDQKKWMEIQFPIFEYDYYNITDIMKIEEQQERQLLEQKQQKRRLKQILLNPTDPQVISLFLVSMKDTGPLGDTLLLSLSDPPVEETIMEKRFLFFLLIFYFKVEAKPAREHNKFVLRFFC